MERIFDELSVLSRSVAYKNLSSAAIHVGLSQPQLSRIVSRIEQTLDVVILDRTAKRKSGWTPLAFKLADLYAKNLRSLDREVSDLLHSAHTSSLKIGTLEGVYPVVLPILKELFDKVGMHLIEIDVYDLSNLEEQFFQNELDLIVTSREPGKRKFRYLKDIGYQSLDKVSTGSPYQVWSPFEYMSQRDSKRALMKQKDSAPILISNSLQIRKEWLNKFGGSGVFPSPLKKKRSAADTERVSLIGSDTLSPVLWKKIEALF